MARLLRLGALFVAGTGAARVDDEAEVVSGEDVRPCADPDHLIYEAKVAAARAAADKAHDTAKFEATLAQEASMASARAFATLSDAKGKVADENCQSNVEKDSLKSRAAELQGARAQVMRDSVAIENAERKMTKMSRGAKGANADLQMAETMAQEEITKSQEAAASAADDARETLADADREAKKSELAAKRARAEQAEKAKEADFAKMQADMSSAMMLKCREQTAKYVDKIQKDLLCKQKQLEKVVEVNKEAEKKANKEASEFVSEEAEARNEEVAVVENHAKDMLLQSDKLKMEAEKQQKLATDAKIKADEMSANAKSTCQKLEHQAKAEKAALVKEDEDKKTEHEIKAKGELEKANAQVAAAAKKLAAAEKSVAIDLAAKEKVEKNIDAVMCKAKKEAEAQNKDAQKTIQDAMTISMKKKELAAKEVEKAEKAAEAAKLMAGESK